VADQHVRVAGPAGHIGSTVVPGLRAKPVIDMLAPTGSLAQTHHLQHGGILA
jgi:GrpB-like predicted nucleotidyltransferase (UPF0157 family)